jgi:hypothetical protein
LKVKTKDEFCCETCGVRHHDCSRISIIYPLSNFFDISTSVSWEFFGLPLWFTLMMTTRLTTFLQVSWSSPQARINDSSICQACRPMQITILWWIRVDALIELPTMTVWLHVASCLGPSSVFCFLSGLSERKEVHNVGSLPISSIWKAINCFEYVQEVHISIDNNSSTVDKIQFLMHFGSLQRFSEGIMSLEHRRVYISCRPHVS